MKRHVLPRHPDQPPFIERIEQIDHVRIVRLRGVIDHTNAENGYEFIVALHEEGERIDSNLLLDCRNVSDIDSAAVALLVMRMRDYLAAGRDVALLHPDSKIKTYLKLAELDPRVRTFESEDEAIRVLASEPPRDPGKRARSTR